MRSDYGPRSVSRASIAGKRTPVHCSTPIAEQFTLNEANVHQHSRHYSAGNERISKHDDCCTYCELYQEGSITPNKRHQIIAWTETVNRSMEHKSSQETTPRNKGHKQQQLRYLKYSPPGSPTSEQGFRKITTKTRKTKKKPDLMKITKVFAEDTIADVTANLAHLAVKFDTEHDDHPIPVGSAPAKYLAPLRQQRSGRKSARRINGLESTTFSLPSDKKVSSRSCSNELLNVITIDDIKRQLRSKMIGELQNPDNTLDEDYMNFDGEYGTTDSRAITYGRSDSKAITDGRTNSRTVSYGMPDSRAISTAGRTDSRAVTLESRMLMNTANEGGYDAEERLFNSRNRFLQRNGHTNQNSSVTSFRQYSPRMHIVEEEDYCDDVDGNSYGGRSKFTKNNKAVMMKTIDEMIHKHDPLHNNSNAGFLGKGKTKPPKEQHKSRRFQKLNRKLHKLMEAEYMPNRLSDRIAEKAALDKQRTEPTVNTRLQMSNGHGEVKGTVEEKAEDQERFLEMLMDMEGNSDVTEL